MKKRTLILVILVLVALLLWWRSPGFQSAPASAPKTALETTSAPMPTPDAKSRAAASSAVTAPATATTPPLQNKVEMLHDLAQTSNKPIQFYGLVIDQDSNPIPGVKVTLSIRTTKESMPGKINDVFEYPVMNSDAQGRFAITDARGALLSVQSLEKSGYESSEKSLNRAHYWYWSDPREVFHPKSEKPEVFHMWKKMGSERLVRKGIGQRIPYDGTPADFDLLEGKAVASGGDLHVMLVRNPLRITYGQTHYEWTATVEAPDGGVIETSDEQMYRAPAEGYQSKLVVHMAADDPQWTDMKTVTVYLKLRGGKYYGRVQLEFNVGSDRQATPFYVTSFVNPSGSRNLEYSSLQDVVQPSPKKP